MTAMRLKNKIREDNRMTHINFVNNKGISKIQTSGENITEFGEKALGLMSTPESWTLPFFIVSKDLLASFVSSTVESEKNNIIKDYAHNIIKCCALTGILALDKIIIRSSGVHERMAERGQLESTITTFQTVEADLRVLLEKLVDVKSTDQLVPLIVQKFVSPVTCGHMSNERRFSKENRDWQIEFYENNSFEDDRIGVRHWRQKFDIEQLQKQMLFCTSRAKLSDVLRIVAEYWYQKNERFHLEFVWDGKNVFVVQADKEGSIETAINPMDICTKISDNAVTMALRVLSIIDLKNLSKYNKLNNVAIYNKVGLTTVPLYLLDDDNIISQLKQGLICQELLADLNALLNIRPIVIRTDLDVGNIQEKQMLPRSNELADINSAKKWLIENAVKLPKGVRAAFIFHNFIPSISSAFVHAIPFSRKVEIQSLWGLPEGLYYNAHDTTIIDLGQIDGSKNDDLIVVKRKPRFKDIMVFSDKNGLWKNAHIAQPHDWVDSITINQAKEMALASQRIANYTKKELSIMWFVGIDQNYYKIDCIPWYHEEFQANMYTPEKFKRKYFVEEEYVIKTDFDLEKIRSENLAIKCIRVKPSDDKILRDKNFLKRVGELAKEKDMRILLEGAQLAHSFYQLTKTGATVVCTNTTVLDYDNEFEFNKLVRDRIPEKIISGGETANCRIANDIFLNTLLLEKLYEECFELIDATDEDEVLEELADVYEVCEAILSRFENNKLSFFARTNIKHFVEANSYVAYSSEIEQLAKLFFDSFEIEENYCSVVLTRKKSLYVVEISISNSVFFSDYETKILDPKEQNSLFIMKNVSKLLGNKGNEIHRGDVKQILDYGESILEHITQGEEKLKTIRDKKNNKNGMFKRGYVLLETDFPCVSNTLKESQISIESVEREEQYPDINYLPFKNYKRSDYTSDEKENRRRLLFRAYLPIGLKEWIVNFYNDKFNDFFCNYDSISFKMRREGDKLLYDIMFDKKTYMENMEFDLS